MLAYLLDGNYASASELSVAGSVTPQTASSHLKKLLDAELICLEVRGRHRYFKLADADVAHALEALALVSERQTHTRDWQKPERLRLRYARCCYGHLAGQLGVSLHDALTRNDRMVMDANSHLTLAPAGIAYLEQIDFDIREISSAASKSSRFAYACLDWSERRDHLAGRFPARLLTHFVEKGWLERNGHRALAVTRVGESKFLTWLAR
jgi:hypothetical protein